MQSPLFLVCTAALAALGAAQAVPPTAHALGTVISAPPDYQVRVRSLHTKRTARGLEVTGKIVNTGPVRRDRALCSVPR